MKKLVQACKIIGKHTLLFIDAVIRNASLIFSLRFYATALTQKRFLFSRNS